MTMSSPRCGPPNAAFESPIRRAQDQEKLIAETAHIPCETTNLAVTGTVPVRLEYGYKSPWTPG
jgi:hypothetical protein